MAFSCGGYFPRNLFPQLQSEKFAIHVEILSTLVVALLFILETSQFVSFLSAGLG